MEGPREGVRRPAKEKSPEHSLRGTESLDASGHSTNEIKVGEGGLKDDL